MKTRLLFSINLFILTGLLVMVWQVRAKQAQLENQIRTLPTPTTRRILVTTDDPKMITPQDRELGLMTDPRFDHIEYIGGVKYFVLSRVEENGTKHREWWHVGLGPVKSEIESKDGSVVKNYAIWPVTPEDEKISLEGLRSVTAKRKTF